MALNKQKILNELGNVVNQLQSADCGCMGKLFSNPNQGNPNAMVSPAHDGYMPNCCQGHGCGHVCHGYNAPGAGEPYSGNRHCMGFCNPPKLYADTYNYLNHNLMQPVVKEVYDDLKSISPANTMMNDPMASQMGLSQGNNPNSAGAGNMGNMMAQNQMPGNQMPGNQMPGNQMSGNQMPGNQMPGNQMPGNQVPGNQMPGNIMGNQNAMAHVNHTPNVRFGNSNMNNANNMQMGSHNQKQMGHMGQPMHHLAGMGPHIVNMMNGEAGARTGGMPNQNNSQIGAMGNNNAPQSPEMGLTSNMPNAINQGQYNTGNTPGNNLGQYNTGNMGMNSMGQGSPGAPVQNPTTQYMSQPNMYAGANPNAQGNPMTGNMNQMNPQQMGVMGASPSQPQMNARNPYGQHSAGMAKFNEMFPGVMQGGDLGFDPMSIAIQMNPANKQRAAMDTMQKMMMSNGEGINRVNPAMMQPVINATNAAAASIAQSNQPPANQVSGQQNMVPVANATAVPTQNNQVPQQQVYTALTGAPTMNQQQVPHQDIPTNEQQYQQQYQGHYQQPQQMVDPKTGAVVTSTLTTVYEGSGDPNARQQGLPPAQSAPPATPAQQMIMDPIFPADSSRNLPPIHMKPQKYYQYNTLGQPIEMVPASSYHHPIPNLPQTLSPQAIPSKFVGDPTRYSNVKATVSKTSLMGNKPIGRTPSRSQLQHIYNQYKGSQSYTQQNIKPSDNGASYSEGHLNIQGNAPRHVPVEKFGGDTVANNNTNNPIAYKTEQMPGQVGDVPAANKPLGDVETKPIASNSKVRNGLQDMTYTSYASSAAWSFHGATPAPYSTGYRFRNKA